MSNFNKILELTSQEDLKIINAIIDRAKKLKANGGEKIDEAKYKRTLIAVHGLCCQLNLEDLIKCNEFVFAHDVFGLVEHFDEEKMVIRSGFVPRAAKYFSA